MGNLIRLSQPSLDREEEEAVCNVMRSGRLVQGPQVEAFEEEFARVVSAPFALATSSGTASLIICLKALDLSLEDEVIVPAYTFIATVNSVALTNGTVVLADVDSKTLNLDLGSLKRVLTDRTKAVLLVHQFGCPADVSAVQEVVGQMPIIEDAACAVGARGKAGPIGMPQGLVACFSFHARKTITTGEGGMITSGDQQLIERLKALRQHGFSKNGLIEPGYNFRMGEIAAAIGRVQLKKLTKNLVKRRKLASCYNELLSDLDWLALPGEETGYSHTYQSYVVRLHPKGPVTRNELLSHLGAHQIECQASLEPVHWHTPYQASKRVSLEVSDETGKHALFLPMHSDLEIKEVERVCRVISKLEH
jgi:perosamine synthetase